MDVSSASLTHPDKFVTFPDRHVDMVAGKIVTPEPGTADVVEVPTCGFRTVTWVAEHPERGWEGGAMLVSRESPHGAGYAHDIVCEILWVRGYKGHYGVVVLP